MGEINTQLFLFIYGTLGSGTIFSDSSIFCAFWLPFLLAFVSIAYEVYAREDGHFVRAIARVFFPAGIAFAIVTVLKHLFASPRPFAVLEHITPLVTVSDPFGSFPSNHATTFAALGVTMFFCNRKLGILYLIGAILVALGRVATGVHWPGDVLAGLLLGSAIGIVSEMLLQRFFSKQATEC